MRIRFQPAHYLETVQLRHHLVEEQKGRLFRPRELQLLEAVLGLDDARGLAGLGDVDAVEMLVDVMEDRERPRKAMMRRDPSADLAT